MFGKKSKIEADSGWRGPARWKTPFYRRTWFSVLLVLLILASVAGFGAFMFFVQPLREKAETFDLGKMRNLEVASIIYDRNGGEMARIFIQNRTPVSISEVPSTLIDALTAQEDSRFFQHKGVDFVGIVRAVWLNFKAGGVTQGASTITQQLARQSFNLLERKMSRKILEAFLAARIERNFSKTEILEMYLNKIYFGAGYHGIQAAAQGYFGKDAKDLSVEESATLCGLIKSPNRLSPLKHPEASIESRNMVLGRMLEEGHISREQYIALKQKPMVTRSQSATDSQLTYIYEDVRQTVMKLVGEGRAGVGGFQIYTTIDPVLQKAAEESVRKRLAQVESQAGYQHQTYAQFKKVIDDYKAKIDAGQINPATPRPKPEYLQCAALVMDNADGSILAMVGGRDFLDSQFNRARGGTGRPVGTAFTPFVYAAAFSRPDCFPGTQLDDTPINNQRVMIGGLTGILGEWGAEAAESKWSMGPISARESLVNSRNAATVRLGEKAGLPALKDFASRAGIQSPVKDYPSSYLGASEAKLDEMCLAYSVFPNKGTRPKEMHLIHRVTDSDDKVVFQVSEDTENTVQAADPVACYQTHSCLVEALHRGTGSPAVAEFGLGPYLAGGKTGTHYEFKDLWFFGYTSAVTCGVWVGFDKQKPIYEGAFSNRIALPVWTDVVNATQKEHPAGEISPPEGADRVELCRKSGMRATDFCYEKVKDASGEIKSVRHTYYEYMRPGTNFDSYCNVHGGGDGMAPDIRAIAGFSGPDAFVPINPDSTKFAHVESVQMKGLTILGADPYQSMVPVLRAKPVEDADGTPVKRPELVDPEPAEANTAILKLPPPPKLRIE
ncbi:MAG: transglycosylase domain-containing protein [Verrucomicrobiaceae bacterium]|nr:transglycosylase domain-containing protein [Verrucomicrobiaceae bacterium]